MVHIKYSKKKKTKTKTNKQEMKPMEKTFQNSSTEKKFSREWNTCRPNKVRGYYPVPKRCSITICGTKGQEDPHSAGKKAQPVEV